MSEIEAVSHMGLLVSQNPWTVYLCLLVAPLVQEDAAVLSAASLSLSGMGETGLIFIFIIIGLVAADISKYWVGCVARTSAWAKKLAEKPAVIKVEKLVHEKLAGTLVSARFMPGARVPLFIGAGYFQAPRLTFLFWMVISALIYVGTIFVLFHTVGAVAGEKAKIWLPVISIGGILLFLTIRYVRSKLRRQA